MQPDPTPSGDASPIDTLLPWIAALRDRVTRGELDGRESIAVGGGTLPDGLAARIMLADVDHDHDLTPEQRRSPFNVERRRTLLADLRRLREQIG